MFYEKPFWIDWAFGNNKISYEKRKKYLWKEPQLYITKLIESQDLNILDLWENKVFEEIEEGKCKSFKWLNYFIRKKLWNTDVFIFDNHNHALFFWYKAYKESLIKKGIDIIHIDQHSDLNEAEVEIDLNKEEDIDYIWNYTNYVLNVGNYIKPSLNSGLIKNFYRIKTQKALLEKEFENIDNYILNIDMDFWAEEMEWVDQKVLKRKLNNLISKADLLTIATSPFFIQQSKAIEKLKEILSF